MAPVLCLITDHRRWGEGWRRAIVEHVGQFAQAGGQLVQVREPEIEAGALADLVAACVRAVAGTRTRVLVNDRLDVALAGGAHGVHLRGDSVSAARVRAHCPHGWLIGRSVHTVDEVRGEQATGLDYVMFGTVFATDSKPGVQAAGLDALTAVAAATPLPVLAVGGMNTATLPLVMAAGAAGMAAIGAFADDPSSPRALLRAHRV